MPQRTATLVPHPRGTSGSPPGPSEFTPLLRVVKNRGLLERRHGWYARTIAVNALALAGLVTAVILSGDTWLTLLLAPLLAVFSARTAFIGHDAGHAQITGDKATSRVIGLVHGNLLLGMSYSWWNHKHNRHHANPNHIDKDPDVAADVLVFTGEQAKLRTGFRRWLTRRQAWLFFPLTLLEGIALKIQGFRDLRRQAPGERAVEGALLVTHVAAYATLLLTVMSPGKALAFAAIHQALFGLHLGMSFAPNHKGMEMPDPDGDPGATCADRCSPPATSAAAPSPTGSSEGSTTRWSTTCFPACPGRICASHSRSCARTAGIWVSPTPRPVSSTPTGRR
ncbi:hypothetical protein SGRIM119S_06378 [Streptomyces griseorubiginosus]